MASFDNDNQVDKVGDNGQQQQNDSDNNGRGGLYGDNENDGGGLQNLRQSRKTADGKDICRDFLNNICNRGNRLKETFRLPIVYMDIL